MKLFILSEEEAWDRNDETKDTLQLRLDYISNQQSDSYNFTQDPLS